jgi:DNA mismatch repair protein MutS2
VGSFRKIATLSSTVNFLLNYFKKFDDYYHLSRATEVELTKEIITAVDQIVDKYGEIKTMLRQCY